jgi:hypothetical protein
MFYHCGAQPEASSDRLIAVIAHLIGQPTRRIVVDLLLRVLAIALILGLILGLLPAMVEASS